jgi:DnaJ-class molecular chaperone
MREEILKVGWKGIMEKYHPDVNTQDPAANELFKMYKYVYEDMKKKLMDM